MNDKYWHHDELIAEITRIGKKGRRHTRVTAQVFLREYTIQDMSGKYVITVSAPDFPQDDTDYTPSVRAERSADSLENAMAIAVEIVEHACTRMTQVNDFMEERVRIKEEAKAKKEEEAKAKKDKPKPS